MTLTIDIDEETQKRLTRAASSAGQSLVEYVSRILRQTTSTDVATVTNNAEPRRLGWAAGRGIWISDDFDAPLEEFKDYM